MPVPVTQIAKTLDAVGELIYDVSDDPMGKGCSLYGLTRTAGDAVLVCAEGPHTNKSPENGPFFRVSDKDQFGAKHNRVTKVWAKAETSSTTIDAGPTFRD